MYHPSFMSAPLPPVRDAPRVPPFAAFLEGWRRVLAAPAVLLGVGAIWYAASWLTALASTEVIAFLPGIASPGYWWTVAYEQVRQFALSFSPELVPFFQSYGLPGSFAGVLSAESLVWLFVSGGALDRYARGRRVGAGPFFSACGVYFFRFIRLWVVFLCVGFAIWQAQRLLPAHLYTRIAVLVVVNVVSVFFDFAKVRAVVEDRLSMLGALAAAGRFIRRRPARVAGLVLFNGLAMYVVLRFQYQLVWAPTPAWLLPVLGALLVLLGVAARLAFMASAVVFFQGELAHAGYTAAPLPMWPDSPAVEAMDNLKRQHSLDDRAR
jgi:hypothetical protein